MTQAEWTACHGILKDGSVQVRLHLVWTAASEGAGMKGCRVFRDTKGYFGPIFGSDDD
jgi:hypothetical protein